MAIDDQFDVEGADEVATESDRRRRGVERRRRSPEVEAQGMRDDEILDVAEQDEQLGGKPVEAQRRRR